MIDPKADPDKEERERREQGEAARRELDETPSPGTDPLHEGP